MVTLKQIGNKLTIIFFLLWSQGMEEKYYKEKNARNVYEMGKTLNVIYTTTILYTCMIL